MANEKFETFLLAEYENIAHAHFETGKQVSTFFNYYLLILAAPVLIVSLIQNKTLDSIINPVKDKDVLFLHWLVILILLLIALVGFALCWIIIELQHDSIVYARTVNGIRNYFYSTASLPKQIENSIRVLPKNTKKPDFYSYRHLGIIVFTFSLVNTSFATTSCYIMGKGSLPNLWLWILILFFLLHFIAHYFLSRNRKNRYDTIRI